ncbi:SDR family NAD(P)-dependent oxidoreductase [Knoellia sp. Soil729]|uniref:SDR family NAD(P)-dependent oxidoreductase n=1 Tax=Knoellia sp. Soil729 TaxID=1736394 RepID=UPI0006F3592D|nr:SDR family NAD(P)-dependent oxidoreductase [Knoellia sp. Soil729]KRE43299.1 3-oxoacyl-ACP reductase [Knoellia sp. Soil729]
MSQLVAIVTGASRGIGAHLADALQDNGYAVERGSRSTASVTDPGAVRSWVADVVARHGRIDLLVNNAGVIDAEVSLERSDPDEWWATMETNVRGPYLMTHAVLPHLTAGTGRIVNVNSGSAYRNSDVATAYNVSKGALARITSGLGLGPDRTALVFDLAPGVVRTDMTESMQAHRGRTEWTAPEEVSALLLAMARGELDEWSGRLVRAGADTVESLRARAQAGLDELDRTLSLQTWGEDDPLA